MLWSCFEWPTVAVLRCLPGFVLLAAAFFSSSEAVYAVILALCISWINGSWSFVNCLLFFDLQSLDERIEEVN